jgi:predicted enzyme related to lactoylglutathione lyase
MQVEHTTQGVPSWIELMTTDEAAALTFYSGVFGWTDDPRHAPEGGTYHMAMLDGSMIAGIGDQNQEDGRRGIPPHWDVYLAVDDADAVTAKVAAAGGHVMVPPMDVMDVGRMAVLADPTGAVVRLWQAKLHQGFGRRSEPGAVSWCELITDDPQRAAAFFSTILDIPTTEMEIGHEAPYTILGPEGEQGAGIMQKTPEMGPMPNTWAVYFEVADADATVARARSLGATVLAEPQDIMPGRFAMLADPQGAVFGIIQSTPGAM